jgi:hypothetical protein
VEIREGDCPSMDAFKRWDEMVLKAAEKSVVRDDSGDTSKPGNKMCPAVKTG